MFLYICIYTYKGKADQRGIKKKAKTQHKA